MAQELKINEDYAEIFGYDPEKGYHLYYRGDDLWEVVSPKGPGGQRVSADTTAKVVEYINRPSVSMGKMG